MCLSKSEEREVFEAADREYQIWLKRALESDDPRERRHAEEMRLERPEWFKAEGEPVAMTKVPLVWAVTAWSEEAGRSWCADVETSPDGSFWFVSGLDDWPILLRNALWSALDSSFGEEDEQ